MTRKNKTHDIDKAAAMPRVPQQIALNSPEHDHSLNPVDALQRATSAPASALRPADILTLQRTVGNRAVQRMLSNQPHSLSRPPSTSAQTIQRKFEEEERLQGRSEISAQSQNRTGLPDRLKTGIENLSGLSLDDVRVHRNSSRPAELQARAYTQGTDIHLGPDEEEHLPHEAWHVVQQKQGRVRPTLQMKRVAINDDAGLEKEADVMGARAQVSVIDSGPAGQRKQISGLGRGGGHAIQRAESDVEPSANVKSETIPQSTDSGAEVFEAGEETHTLWVEQVGDDTVVMVASDPLTVPQRLGKWEKEAAKMQPSGLKTNILDWIKKCRAKSQLLEEASQKDDREKREGKVHTYAAELKEMLKKLFWAFKIDLPELGAVAVYRGLHFSQDWEEKRGRTVQAESERTFESVKGEGAYSSATWELAKGLAGKGKILTSHLESANLIVMKVLDQWKANTDFTRADTSKTGKSIVTSRAALEQGIANFKVANPNKSLELQGLLDKQKEGFTQSGNKFENQFAAALSRYIEKQSTFEGELGAKSEGGYKDVPFGSIPFISTTKVAGEAVKYAQGKLASDQNRSTVGTVGRILVYVAHRVDLLEAGGIDVWEKLGEGKLRFTDWRMNENEITFAGKMPDYFLRDMTPVDGGEQVDTAANRAEVAAAKAAAPFGGLKPLPKNKPHT